MVSQTISEFKTSATKSLEFLKGELATIQTGRASTTLVEGLQVQYYGTPTPLQQLATISTPEPTQILIEPFDKNALKDVEKAINESDLGLTGNNDGEKIRITIPPLTEERRKQLVTVVHQKLEEARIAVRNAREDAWKKVKAAQEAGSISEDEKYKAEEDLNKEIGQFNDQIKEIGDSKESEIMTV